jgi:hypothetical protein
MEAGPFNVDLNVRRQLRILKSLDINADIPLRRKALWKQSDQFKIKK